MSERFGFRSALRTLDADSRFGNLVSFRSPQIPFLKGAVFAALFADPKSAKTRNRRLLIHVPFDTKRYRFKKPVSGAEVSMKGSRSISALQFKKGFSFATTSPSYYWALIVYTQAFRSTSSIVLHRKTERIVIYPIDQYIIDAVRKERKRQNISQALLAYGIGVSKSFIGQVESPKYNIKYNPHHINEIAKYLGCSPRDFLPENPL